jgi:hypothetical protein
MPGHQAPAISRYPELQVQWIPFFAYYLHFGDRFEDTHQNFGLEAWRKRYNEYCTGLEAV